MLLSPIFAGIRYFQKHLHDFLTELSNIFFLESYDRNWGSAKISSRIFDIMIVKEIGRLRSREGKTPQSI